MILSVFDEVVSSNNHSRLILYKHTHHIHRRALSHENATVVQAEGELAQKPDRCGPVAFRCYEPILSYVDGDGQFCGWKEMNTFGTLPEVCAHFAHFG